MGWDNLFVEEKNYSVVEVNIGEPSGEFIFRAVLPTQTINIPISVQDVARGSEDPTVFRRLANDIRANPEKYLPLHIEPRS